MSILITGASGKYANDAISFLLEKGVNGNDIIGTVRDESKFSQQLKSKGVQVKKADYDDYNSLVSALKGVEKVLLISSNEITKRLKQHENIINAAKENNVKFIAYTSMEIKREDGSSPIHFIESEHIETEKLIKQSGIQYTILRNALYTECLPEYFFGPKVLEQGIYFPAGKGTANYATRRDLAEVGANVIIESDKHVNKSYILTNNNERPSFDDAAKVLSEIAGKQLNYVSPDVASYKQTLSAIIPENYINFSIAFALALEQGDFNSDKSDLQTLLKREPTTFKQFLNETYKRSN